MSSSRTQIVVGLDIGATKICAITGEVSADGMLTILGSGLAPSAGIRRGVVADIDATAVSIREAVRQAEENSGVDIESVTVGVTGEHIASLNSHGVVSVNHPHLEITQEAVDRVLDNARMIVIPPDREILHTIPRWFIVDGLDGIQHPEGMSASRLEVDAHIVTGTRTYIDNVLKSIHRTGLGIDAGGVVLQPLATADAVLLPAERDLGCVLVDIGGSATDVAVFTNGAICHTGVVPIAGEHVTRDIAVGIRVDMEEAERLKTDWGTALTDLLDRDELIDVQLLGENNATPIPRSILAEIIEARMIELFEKVRDQMRRAGVEDHLSAGVVVTGGGSRLHGTDQVAAEVLDLTARLASPVQETGMSEALNHPRYATAVGLTRIAAANLDVFDLSGSPSQGGGRKKNGIFRRIKRAFGKR